MNIPLPHSYVFPPIQEDQDNCSSVNQSSEACNYHISSGELLNGKNEKSEAMVLSHFSFDTLVSVFYWAFF